MRGARKRRRLWLTTALGAVALQVISPFVATATAYVPDPNWTCGGGGAGGTIYECPARMVLAIHPLIWVGIGLYLGGAGLMGLALFLLHRAPRQPRPRPVAA